MGPFATYLYSSIPTGLLVWCGVGFCAGIFLFFRGFIVLQRRRLVLDTPFSKIRSASMGMVELSGQAVGPFTMVAPITGRPCYYYRTVVWEYKQEGKNKSWVKAAAESMHVPFFLDDNTGKVLVDPRGADLDLHRDFQQQFNGSFFSMQDDPPPNVCSFLARHGIQTSNKIKVEEFCIKPKNSLFILGTLAENPGIELKPEPVADSEPALLFFSNRLSVSFSVNTEVNSETTPLKRRTPGGTTEAAPVEIIRLTPDTPISSTEMSQQQRIAAALLKAGISNPAAWAAAGVTSPAIRDNPAPVTVVDPSFAGSTANGSASPDAVSRAAGFEPHPATVLMKGANNNTFLISWRSQQEIVRSLAWKCALMIWGGPALALASLYFLLSAEGLL